jgi:pimeloyl-ACP methyl ester carboxylesterase
MLQDQVQVMRDLGFDRFAVVGHDRGGRVAGRLATERLVNLTEKLVRAHRPNCPPVSLSV